MRQLFHDARQNSYLMAGVLMTSKPDINLASELGHDNAAQKEDHHPHPSSLQTGPDDVTVSPADDKLP